MRRVDLERAARRVGARPEFEDWQGRRRRVGPATLAALIEALGEDGGDRAARPVVASGRTEVPVGRTGGTAVLRLDDGTERPLAITDGTVTLPADVPIGVHHIQLGAGADGPTGLRVVLRRPPPRPVPSRLVGTWGAFVAVHAIRATSGDRGIGTLTDLDRLGAVLEPWRPRLLSVLPLFAVDPGDPSPYSPVSQHFWNEAHLDLGRLWASLGLAPPDPAATLATAPASASPPTVRSAAPVDWPAVTAQVHHHLDLLLDRLGDRDPASVLTPASRTAPSGAARPGARRSDPARAGIDGLDPAELEAYCAFRAGGDERAHRRHRLAQLAMEHQLAELAGSLGRRGQALTLDLPVGTSAGGFDVAHRPDLFLDGWSIGAPPDEFFRLGQSWGLPPVHPGRASATGHDYLGRSVAALARHAGAIRVDHVMGLERLWWVPPGASADEGVYVSQPTDELAARLAIEIHRAGAAVIGENLGTVPPTTAAVLEEEGMLGMYEELFAVGGLAAGGELPEVPTAVAAGTGTHDMPTFAGFVAGADVALAQRFQGVSAEAADEMRDGRRRDVAAWAAELGVPARAPALLGATLHRLNRSEAAHVVIGLDDLWLELEPLNVPGTGPEVANWRRRMRLDLDQVAGSPSVRRHLDTVADGRRAEGAVR